MRVYKKVILKMLNKTVKKYLIHKTLQNNYLIVLKLSKIPNGLLTNTLSLITGKFIIN